MKIENINHALVPKAHTQMYLMHKFWARKPHNVVAEYIKHYSKEGDIVLDPFVGSGVTAIEAIKIGRKAVAVDLDPIATFITKMTAMTIDLTDIEIEFKKIEKNVKERISKFYETECPRCKKKAEIICTHWENSKPIKIMFRCFSCKKRSGKKPSDEDIRKIKEIEKMKIPYWCPKTRLYYNHLPFKEGTHQEGIDSIPDLFTKRNLISLTILYHEIENIQNKKLKELIKFAFTSIVHLASKMTPVRPTRLFSSFWPVHRYWIPPIFMESNVWMLFKSKIRGKQGIIVGKKDSNEQIKHYKEANKFDDLNDDANILINTINALELTKIIPNNSIDYIFTDPPYGGAIQYFELSTLWCSWLKGEKNEKEFELDYDGEITVNKNQKKDFEYYHKMLKAAFRQMYLVLKPGKYLTITFHNTDIKIWNSIIKAVVLSGFELEKIIYQPPARASAKGLLQPYGSAVGDYYIRFRKPEIENQVTEKQMDMKRYEDEVVFSAKRILNERGEPTIYQHILNGIMADLHGGRYVPIGARNIDEILKDNVNKVFELIDVKNEKGKVIGKKWWVKGKDFSTFLKATLSDRVERAILSLLDRKIKVSFDEVLQSIFIEFQNALTPDTQNIREILKEYALPTKDGKWRLKPGLSERERESQHTKMIYLIAILGKKAGYKILIGSNEQSSVYEGRQLRDLCDFDKILTYQHIAAGDDFTLNRIKQIDVLWIDSNDILRYVFEVENTTGISDAIIRGSNLLGKVNRFIIIPKERESFLHKRLQEPLIQQSLQKDMWNFIRYNNLEDLFEKYNKKERFDPDELDPIAKSPKITVEKQANLNQYQK
jgi:DNA modification methylase